MNNVTVNKVFFLKTLIYPHIISSVRMSASSWLLSADPLLSAIKQTHGSIRRKLPIVNALYIKNLLWYHFVYSLNIYIYLSCHISCKRV